MGFDENNYMPIPSVSRVTLQNINPRPTSTPKPAEEQQLNISDPTHNRVKINRVNSFDTLKNGQTLKQKLPKEDLSKAQA